MKKAYRVYIAGPYTVGDVGFNVSTAIVAAHYLMNAGHHPYVPHLSHFMHIFAPRSYEDWFALDVAWLERSDVLVRLPGESPGGDREVMIAKELGIPVYGGRDPVSNFLEVLRETALEQTQTGGDL
jgi:hypothetical protein